MDHSSAKHARSNRESYMVGALARFNCNHEQLHDEAKQLARKLGLAAPCHNPFMNTTAQLVETVHCVKEAIILCDKLLERGLRQEERSVPIRAGLGVGAVEVPRGTLYHEYAVDSKGIITDANLVIPTGQNHANIEQDMTSPFSKIKRKPLPPSPPPPPSSSPPPFKTQTPLQTSPPGQIDPPFSTPGP